MTGLTWPERLARGDAIKDERGCLIWQRALTSKGYGAVYIDGKVRLAHRAAWRDAHGDWPPVGLVVDHRCAVKACVNPEHLEAVPNHVNLRRAIPRGDEQTEARRRMWRAANQRRRQYGPLYTIGGE